MVDGPLQLLVRNGLAAEHGSNGWVLACTTHSARASVRRVCGSNAVGYPISWECVRCVEPSWVLALRRDANEVVPVRKRYERATLCELSVRKPS